MFPVFLLCDSVGPEEHISAVKKLQEDSRSSAKVCTCVCMYVRMHILYVRMYCVYTSVEFLAISMLFNLKSNILYA